MKTLFLSAELSTLDSAENARRSTILLGILHVKGYNFKPLVGVYKGSREKSFAVEVGVKEMKELIAIAKNLNQESVLIVDEKNKAVLNFLSDNSKQTIGKLKIATKEVAEKMENYSFDETSGKYFVVQ
jgi:hypothetical protein